MDKDDKDLRDYFAGQALAGLLASNLYDRVKLGKEGRQPRHDICDFASQLAYEYADRMLDCREHGRD